MNRDSKFFHCGFFFLFFILNFSSIYSTTGSYNIGEAERQFFLKDFPQAKKILLEIIKSRNDRKAFSLLGDIYFQEKKYIVSLEYYNKAIAIGIGNGYEKYRSGQIYLELKKDHLAINAFQETYQNNPEIKESLFQIGYIYLYKYRDKYQTIKFWKKFIRESPNDPQRDKIEKAIFLLEDKNFIIDPQKNPLPIEEILLFGNQTFNNRHVKPNDTFGGKENIKSQNKIKDIISDDEDTL